MDIKYTAFNPENKLIPSIRILEIVNKKIRVFFSAFRNQIHAVNCPAKEIRNLLSRERASLITITVKFDVFNWNMDFRKYQSVKS